MQFIKTAFAMLLISAALLGAGAAGPGYHAASTADQHPVVAERVDGGAAALSQLG